jgi:hypothetical protein
MTTEEKAKELFIDESLPKITMVQLLAKLFAFIAREVGESFGEEGEEAVVRAVRRFGEERGRGIAKRASLRGLPNTPENYLESYDMDRSSEFSQVSRVVDGELLQDFSRCPIAKEFQDSSMERWGRLYCDNIDAALAKGFNPDMECLHPEHFLDGGCCRFIFRLAAKKKKGGPK